MEGENNVGSDGGEAIANIVIEPTADRGDSYDYGNTNHNAQHGQTRAQLVGADRVRCHLDDFAELALTHHRLRWSVARRGEYQGTG